jgi:hypothetical protein
VHACRTIPTATIAWLQPHVRHCRISFGAPSPVSVASSTGFDSQARVTATATPPVPVFARAPTLAPTAINASLATLDQAACVRTWTIALRVALVTAAEHGGCVLLAACPGGASTPCKGLQREPVIKQGLIVCLVYLVGWGTCSQGIAGSGVCACNTGFRGPACDCKPACAAPTVA